MNKKLYDSNDGLRSALAQNMLVNNRKVWVSITGNAAIFCFLPALLLNECSSVSQEGELIQKTEAYSPEYAETHQVAISLSAFSFLPRCDVDLRSVMCTCFPSSVDESIERDPSKGRYSDVASWADKYLDSGVSITTETAASSYDSDDSRQSVETAHHSYSCAFSDAEVFPPPCARMLT